MDLDEEEQAQLEADLSGVKPITAQNTMTGKAKQTERMMTPEEARHHLRLLFQNEQEICSLIYGSHGPLPTAHMEEMSSKDRKAGKGHVKADTFFLDVVLVPPSRFRPAASLGDMLFESPQNELLSAVVSRETLHCRHNMLN
jgi:DNA-directed RNA polymerase I subunit RPA1